MLNSEQASRRKVKPFERALYDFMCMAGGQPQSYIVRHFVQEIITYSDVCEEGTVHFYLPDDNPARDKGRLKLCERATMMGHSLDQFPGKDFGLDEGLAGLVFRKRSPELAARPEEHPQFVPIAGQDVRSLYCVPILLDRESSPFGVVSFHNFEVTLDKDGADKRLLMDIAVKVLEAMLALAPIPLVPKQKVFIVHGRDEKFLQELIDILEKEKIEPVVVQTYARTGQDLLGFIESRIRSCLAGFVLLTPDDEGRLYDLREPMRQRARQNVIFEGGYLTALFRRTNRICFLQKADLEIPSDLNGLLMERFDREIDAARIAKTLSEWGLGRTHARAGDRTTV